MHHHCGAACCCSTGKRTTSSRKDPSCPLNTVYVFSVCAVYVRVCMLRYYCQALDMQPILAVVHQSGCTDRVTFICVLETCRSEKNIVKSIAVLTQTTRHFQFRDASDHCSTVSTLWWWQERKSASTPSEHLSSTGQPNEWWSSGNGRIGHRT